MITRKTIRRLTATEWERLQGLPDGYTAVEGATDAQRKQVIGNGFCVPVIRWIGERIDFLHRAEW